MRAIRVSEPGGPEKLVLADEPAPVPAAGELLVEVHATALNRADLLQRRGLYPPPPGASQILGLECSGIVSGAGPGADQSRIGERVMALLPGGGYAELAAIPDRLAMPVPASLSFEEAAAIPEAFLTAAEALFERGGLAPGELVLIHAAGGGVGSAAVELALAFGARVIATTGSEEKRIRLLDLGAQSVVNYGHQDFIEVVRDVSEGRGVDVILDFVGAKYAERHAECLADGGRQVVLGLLGGTSATVDYGKLLRKRQSLLGLVMRSRPVSEKAELTQRFVRRSLPLFADGRLRPIVDSVFPLEEARLAHERMEQNLNFGKIVLKVR